MRRFCIILFTLLGVMTTATAGIVTESEARKKAEAFLSTKGGTAIKNRTIAKANPYRAARKKQQADASYYVFNIADNGGFVIVSGDDSTEEILGYADSGSFDANNIPTNIAAWLQGYAEQIEKASSMAAANARQANPQKVATHPAIEPLVKTKWNQGSFSATGNAYNYQTPLVKDYWTGEMKHAVTGCVATAMAQIMNYHQWPNEVGAIDEYQYQQSGTTVTVPAIPATTFDWANMLNEYDRAEDAEASSALAISTLMRYCGQAVEMKYGEDGQSAASSGKAERALKNTFGYDDAVRYVYRSIHTINTWDELIYNELSEKRPVLYNGQSSGGGHAFICDGYDGKGFYHINWGWGGLNDGYFKLSVMNPYTNRSGYSVSQSAIVGICPDDGHIYEDTATHVAGGTFYFIDDELRVQFSTQHNNTFDFGFGKVEADGSVTHLSTIAENLRTMSAASLAITLNPHTLSELSLPAGTYKIVVISKVSSGNVWYNATTSSHYIEVGIDENGQVSSVTVHTPSSDPNSNLNILNFEFLNPLYTNMPQEMMVTIQNNGEEFNDVLYLFDNNVKIDKTGFAIEEGATDYASFYFTPEDIGIHKLDVSIDEEGQNIIGSITIEIKPTPIGEVTLELISEELVKDNPVTWSFTLKNNSSIPSVLPLTFDCWSYKDGKDSFLKTFTQSVIIEPSATETIEFSFEGFDIEQGNYKIIIWNSYYLTETTTAQKGVFTKEFHYGGYTLNIPETLAETLILPFEAQIPQGVKAYTLEYRKAVDAILATEVTTPTLPANLPVLVMADQEGDYIFAPRAGLVSIIPSEQSTFGALTGTYRKIASPYAYQLISKDSEPVFARSDEWIYPYHAYLSMYGISAGDTLKVYLNESDLPELPIGEVTLEVVSEELVKDNPVTWSFTLKNNSSIPSVLPLKFDCWFSKDGKDSFLKTFTQSVIIEPGATETVEIFLGDIDFEQGDYKINIWNSYYLTETTTAQKGVFTKRFYYGGYTLNIPETLAETLVLPFEAQIPQGVKAYTLEYRRAEDAILATEVTTPTLTANLPVLVMAGKEGDYIFAPQTGLVSIIPSERSTFGALVGVYGTTGIDSNSYYLISQDGGPAFTRGQAITILPYHAYMSASGANAAEMLNVYFDENDIPSDIKAINRMMEDGDIYTLQGVKVTGKLKQGIYIKNGVKFVVK